MNKRFIRQAALIGEAATEKLQNSRVALFGVGGVGSYALESLVRSGIGNVDVFDNDTVSESNVNRQIIATQSTIGLKKIDAAAQRAKDINPEINFHGYDIFYLPDVADGVDLAQYDYVIDAIDTVTAKIELIIRCQRAGVPIISVMGTGNKLDPTALRVDDIYKTHGCPLARVMRTQLKKRGIEKLDVVWSQEAALVPNDFAEIKADGRKSPGSTAFVPAAAGIIAAAQVVKNLIK